MARFTPLLLLALLGCSDWGRDPAVEITSTPLDPLAARQQSVAALSSGHHEIVVRRVMSMPDSCHRVAGELMGTGSDLTLRVAAEPDGGDCPPKEAAHAYTATIRKLRPGRYNLRVIHAFPRGETETKTVLWHPILVLERNVGVQ